MFFLVILIKKLVGLCAEDVGGMLAAKANEIELKKCHSKQFCKCFVYDYFMFKSEQQPQRIS